MKIVATGFSGLIGSALGQELIKKHELVQLVRQPIAAESPDGFKKVLWNPKEPGAWESEVDGADAVINLSGESIASSRWTAAQKAKLISSRLSTVQALVRAMEKASRKPRVFLSASAIGFYGPRDTELVSETASAGSGFLPSLSVEWERQASKAALLGVRTVLLRTGIVLSLQGGALAKMLLPFKLGIGGPLGDGRQGMSWIHIEDELRAICWALENESVSGPLNLTAPNPVSMKDFARILGKALNRPALFPVPGFMLKILLGEMSEMLLTGQFVVPQKLIDSGFKFRYPSLPLALQALLQNKSA